MSTKKGGSLSTGAFSIQDVIDGINATEKIQDSTIAAGAKVVCTSCPSCGGGSQMIKGGGSLLLQKSIELSHRDIEFAPFFPSCATGDHICKPEIERGEWQDYDETKKTSTGGYSLLKDKSYMFCTKGFGIIYATDNGQKIDRRQAESLALLFQRWQDNPEEMGYLKGIGNCYAYSKDPVNLNTGNFIYEHEDLKVAGVMPLLFKRFYNAMDTRSGVLGEGWIHNYEMHLSIKKNQKLLLFLADGKEEPYRQVSNDLYRNERNGLETIQVLKTGIESTYVYTTFDQKKHYFDQTGKEQKREDANGNQIIFCYDEQGRLAEAKGAGAALLFNYEENSRLSGIQDHCGRKVQFDYGEDGLTHVTDPDGHIITYQYGKHHKIEAVINARGIQSVMNEYDQHLRVTKQIFPDEGEVNYFYHDQEKMVDMVEQNGNSIKHYYDQQYRNIKTVYEDGKEEFTYNEQSKKIRYKDKRGYLTRYEYDRRGNETKRVDPLGNKLHKTYNEQNQVLTFSVNGVMKLKNQYDKKGNLVRSTDAIKRSNEFCYNPLGLPSELTRPDGSRYQFQYDGRGNLTEVREPGDYRLRYCYDDLNRIVKTIDANGNQLSYRYDNRNNLIEVTNAGGKTRHYIYNENQKVTSFTDYDGNTIYQEYGVLNKPNKIIDAMGNETLLEYDQMWNLCQVTNPNGGVTKYSYNHINLLESVTDPMGQTISFSYDQNGNRVQIIDANKHVTEFEYDALNRVTQVREPDGQYHSYEYNDQDQVTVYTDPLGQVTAYEYDDAGQKVKEINALGEETNYRYSVLGKLTHINKGEYCLVTYEYDDRGLMTAEYHLNGDTAYYHYDGNQNVIKKTNQKGYILEYQYDDADRVISISSNQGQQNHYRYDSVGNLTEMTDSNRNLTKYLYDPCGNLIGVIDPEGNQTAYGYDQIGNLTHILQGRSEIFSAETRDFTIEEVLKRNHENQTLRMTLYQWNLAGKIEKKTDPLGNSESYRYNPLGKLAGKIDKEGYSTSYEYDLAGLLSKVRYEDGKEVRFSYNPLRQLTAFEDWLGITRIEHDPLGRTVKVTDYKDQEVSYEYGEHSERKSITYPDGQQVSYRYDECLRLREVDGIHTKVTYEYDRQNNLREKSFGNHLKSTYHYNALGQLEQLTNWNRGQELDIYRYRYDAMGNKADICKERMGLRKESGRYGYHYDALNRLQMVSKDGGLLRRYSYDAYGNRTGQTEGKINTQYQYNDANQLISKVDMWMDGGEVKNEERYIYDKRGNLTQIYQNGGLTHQYQFGSFNQLEQAQNYQKRMEAIYYYNGLGSRIGKFENELPDAINPEDQIENLTQDPAKETWDVLDLTRQYQNLLQRTKNQTITSFTWGYDVLSANHLDGTQYCYLQDESGSPIRLLDDTGTSREVFDYDEFGNQLYPAKSVHQPFGFTGHQPDPVTDTYFAQAREYQPRSGRFISEDLIKGFIKAPMTLNSYTYCWNQPTNFVDLDGNIPTAYEAAKMADHVYGADNEDKNKEVVNGWVFEEVKTNTNTWIEKNLTANGMVMGVYSKTHADGTVEYALVNKGTTMTSVKNWVDNLQQFFSSSGDTRDSVKTAVDFVNEKEGYEVTMIGHSKGGAEARMNALATDTSAILFNPATSSWQSGFLNGVYPWEIWDYDESKMKTYIVKGEILNKVEGWMTDHIGDVIWLNAQDSMGMVDRHLMDAVYWGLENTDGVCGNE